MKKVQFKRSLEDLSAQLAKLRAGTEIDISYKPTVKPTDHDIEVVAITQKLIKRHKQALKNLSQR